MSAPLGDDEFVGYTFRGAPERRPRLWFLDRYLEMLFRMEGWAITLARSGEGGTWTVARRGFDPVVLGPCVRYNHVGAKNWTAVWQLTDTTIGHVHNFGRDDDVWRLGVWPD